jgi:four helix bundle protein
MQSLSYKVKSEVGQRTYVVGLRVIKLCNHLPSKKLTWIITDQLLRSSMSIGANIAEAQGSSSRLEFKKFYEIALKSGHETLYWLHMLLDAELVTEKNVSGLISEVEQITKMLGKSVLTLKSKKLQS